MAKQGSKMQKTHRTGQRRAEEVNPALPLPPAINELILPGRYSASAKGNWRHQEGAGRASAMPHPGFRAAWGTAAGAGHLAQATTPTTAGTPEGHTRTQLAAPHTGQVLNHPRETTESFVTAWEGLSRCFYL